jgi:hypothetical protein
MLFSVSSNCKFLENKEQKSKSIWELIGKIFRSFLRYFIDILSDFCYYDFVFKNAKEREIF